MQPGEAPFLRAILEDPADNVARLIFADWLDDRGEHCRAATIRAEVADPSLITYSMEHRGIPFEEFEWHVPQPLPSYFFNSQMPFGTKRRRGFIEQVQIDGHYWQLLCDDLMGEHPITTVWLLSMPRITLPRARGAYQRMLLGSDRRRSYPLSRYSNWRADIKEIFHREWPRVGFIWPEPRI
jgi:uncharacterized protein (TIGR02996 family)